MDICPDRCTMGPSIQIDLLFATTALVRPIAKGKAPELCRLGSATGFFFQQDDRKFLATNRHVIIEEESGFYPDHLVVRLHASRTDPDPTRDIEIPLYDESRNPLWMEHPTTGIDLAALQIGDLVEDTDMIEYWKSDRLLPNDVRVDPGAEMLVVGYPMEFYDTKHYLPIVRSGTLATTYGAMFRGQPVFLIDANLHPGTSGSPVVLPRSAIQATVSGDVRMGQFPPYLLGVNSGEYHVEGIGLGLNTVWYARLILDIVSRPKFASSSLKDGSTSKSE